MLHSKLRLAVLVGGMLAALLLAAPAAACGCGAYVPREGDAHVAQERALLRWDGRNEDIVMALSVDGRSEEAAWILPVPSRASVQLADPELFDALQTLTKPLVRVERIRGDGVGAGAPGAGVTVLERQALGPFDVATLAAGDSTALSGWLSENGFQFPSGLEAVLEPYVAQGWEYVAVRLTPQAAGELSGDLDPLWVTFASDTLVYPMRPTALARNPLPVFLYVLADHRVAQPPAFDAGATGTRPGWSEVSYAQWIEPDSLEVDSPLAAFVDRRLFLTKFDIFLQNPEAIEDDFVFSFAPADELAHKVEVRYETVRGPSLEEPGTWVGPLAALVVLAAALAATLLILRRRRRQG